MPGMLTGIAAVLTAITGLLVAVYPHGLAGSKDGAAVSPKAPGWCGTECFPRGAGCGACSAGCGKGTGSASASVMPVSKISRRFC